MSRIIRFSATVAGLTCLWYLLSGMGDALHLGIGIAAALVIGAIHFPWRREVGFPVLRFLSFIPRHAVRVAMSNLHVAKLVLGPKSNIEPRFIRMPVGLSDEREQTTLACAITLTPGTLTINVDQQSILVHALDPVSATDVENGAIEADVRRVFGGAS